ncbi:Rho termination factor N-terminal domain-containing protein, partial [[Clostridium] symbiosum]
MREKLQTLPLTQLRELAKAQGLKGVTTLKKAEIIDRLCEIAGGKAADKDLAGMDAAGAEGGGVHNIIPSEPLAAAEEKKTDEKPSETIDKEPRILKKNTREEKREEAPRRDTNRYRDDSRKRDYQPRGDYQQRSDNQSRSDYQQRGDNQSRGDYQQRGDNQSRGDYQQRGDNQSRGDYQQRGESQSRGDYQQRGESQS